MQNLNSVPLPALRTIEAIARTGTLKAAADELGVTPGALSQRLAKAEDALGRTMFVRSSTGLKPNKICLAILPRLSLAMADLNAVVMDLSKTETSVLTISVAPIFASRWLIWRISRFNLENPTISVRLDPRLEIVDLDRSEIDLGIRVGENLLLDENATKLLDQMVFPICSPELANSVQSPRDLLKLPIIRENENFHGWDVWLTEQGLGMPHFSPGPTYSDASLCLDAAMAGQGVFMAWETLACDALERNQIVAPFRQRSKTSQTYWLVANKFSANKASVKKFRSWLQKELESSVKEWRT